MKLSLGYTVSHADYIEYMIWLLERDLYAGAMSKEDKIYFVNFKDEQDAIAFKLRFCI